MMDWFKGIEFAYPGFFWLFLIIPLMIGWYIWKNRAITGHARHIKHGKLFIRGPEKLYPHIQAFWYCVACVGV